MPDAKSGGNLGKIELNEKGRSLLTVRQPATKGCMHQNAKLLCGTETNLRRVRPAICMAFILLVYGEQQVVKHIAANLTSAIQRMAPIKG